MNMTLPMHITAHPLYSQAKRCLLLDFPVEFGMRMIEFIISRLLTSPVFLQATCEIQLEVEHTLASLSLTYRFEQGSYWEDLFDNHGQ